jgi:putative transposase
MARLTRLSVAGAVHYVRLRAASEISLMPSEEDIETFLHLLAQCAKKHDTDVAAYALVPDQIQLLLIPRRRAESLSECVQALARLYSMSFNDRYSRSGTIWLGRFASSVIGGQENVLRATVYLEHLSERVNIASAEDYPWSSFSHHAGLRSDGFLTPTQAYWNLGNTPFERQRMYRKFFEEELPEEFCKNLVQSIPRGWPVGDAKFLSEIKADEARIRPIRGRGRPKKTIADPNLK